MEPLSVQQLLDCSWGYNNNGCRGGWSWRAFQFVKDHGIATRRSYGKYLGQVELENSTISVVSRKNVN